MTEENCRLPPEIVEEILYKLPVKSLNRFRCVSTSWQSLISENRFVRKHLSRAKPDKTLILNDPDRSGKKNMYYFPMSSLQRMSIKGGDYFHCPFGGNYTQLLASYDGLLCVRVDQSVYIWNPCLETCRKIPNLTGMHTSNDIPTCFFGLGYDSTSDDYKLIKHFRHGTEVYSLKSDSWNKLNNFPHDYHDYCPSTSVFVNGSIHYLAFGQDLIGNSFTLFSFDLSDNKYRELTLPECFSKYSNNYGVNLSVLKGMLCVLVWWNSRLVLWAMKDYYSDQKSWAKILDIRFEVDVCCTWEDVKPFYMFDNGEVLMGAVFKHGTELLICKDNAILIRQIIFGPQSWIRYGFVHVESLISI